MTLRYDFDMFSVVPEGIGALDQGQDVPHKSASQQIALWRDPKTVDALRGADPVVKDYFRASGFGLNAYDSGAPTGFYPAYDEVSRIKVIERLSHNLAKYDLAQSNLNGFDFAAFLEYVTSARPWDDPGQGLPAPQASRAKKTHPFGPVGVVNHIPGPGSDLPGQSQPQPDPPQARRGRLALTALIAAALYMALWKGSTLLGVDAEMLSQLNTYGF